MKIILLFLWIVGVIGGKFHKQYIRTEGSSSSSSSKSSKSFLIQNIYGSKDFACANPISQIITELGVCVAATTPSGYYFLQTLTTALPYQQTTTFYTDATCQNIAVDVPLQTVSIALNQCSPSTRTLYQQVINRSGAGSSSQSASGGYTTQKNTATLALFPTIAACQAGSYGGSVASSSGQLYLCVPSVDGDVIYSGCVASTTLNGVRYASTDGSCTGTSQSFQYSQADWCNVNGSVTSLNNRQGVTNVFCS